MRKRVVIGGAVAAVFATAVVISALVLESAKVSDGPNPNVAQVLVAAQDIQPGQAMDPILRAGRIMEIDVPLDALVDGAVTDVSQLEGRIATRPIDADEQILAGSLRKQELTVFAERDSAVFLKGAWPIIASYLDRDVSATEWLTQAEGELPRLQRLLDRNRDPISWGMAVDMWSRLELLQRALIDRDAEGERRACQAARQAHERLTRYWQDVAGAGTADPTVLWCTSRKLDATS